MPTKKNVVFDAINFIFDVKCTYFITDEVDIVVVVVSSAYPFSAHLLKAQSQRPMMRKDKKTLKTAYLVDQMMMKMAHL